MVYRNLRVPVQVQDNMHLIYLGCIYTFKVIEPRKSSDKLFVTLFIVISIPIIIHVATQTCMQHLLEMELWDRTWDGFQRLHRYWRPMLETKYVDDNFEMVVTVLADLVTNILYLLALPMLKVGHQHPKDVTNIEILSPT